MRKTILLLVLVLISLFPVSAGSSDFEIEKVYVNGIRADDDSMVQVELGSTTQVVVFIEGTGDYEDVRIRAWVGGYDHGDIEVTSDVFDVENGVTYKEYLYLEIPEDMDVNDHKFTLYVDVYSGDELERVTYTLYFEEESHKVLVEDIILSKTTIEPDSYLGIQVRLSNEGENDEDNLKITVSIPELGISNRVYMDELDYDTQADSETIYLTIPDNAATGTYEVEVYVEYDDGYSLTEDLTYLRVDGDSTIYDENAIVSIETIKDLVTGEESTFKVQVTNLGKTTKEFTLTITGMDSDQIQTVTVSPGKSAELVYSITPHLTGLQTLQVEVTSKDGAVETELFYVTVQEPSQALTILLGTLLVLVFLVLLVMVLRQKR
jgi:hypothetical protein